MCAQSEPQWDAGVHLSMKLTCTFVQRSEFTQRGTHSCLSKFTLMDVGLLFETETGFWQCYMAKTV